MKDSGYQCTKKSEIHRDLPGQAQVSPLARRMTGRAFQVAAVVILVLLGSSLWFVKRQLESSWLLFGAHPEVMATLEESLVDQRRLAELEENVEARESLRQRFDRSNLLLQRLRILELNREALSRRFQWFLLAFFLVSLGTVAALALLHRRRTRRRLRALESVLGKAMSSVDPVKVDDPERDLLGRIGEVVERLSERTAGERRRLALTRDLEAWQEGAQLVAHEMKTPLTALKLDLAALDSDEFEAADYHSVLKRTKSSLQSMEDFVARYSELARLPTPKPEYAHLVEFVEEFVEHFGQAWPQAKLGFHPADAGDGHCWFDPESLRRVLHNLCQNSVEAWQEAAPTVGAVGSGSQAEPCRVSSERQERERRDDYCKIDFSLHENEHSIHLDVSDNGPGVPTSMLESLFHPYSSSKGSSGLGVGLAASRKILLDQGGNLLLVDSDSGARFRLSLDKRASSLEAASLGTPQ